MGVQKKTRKFAQVGILALIDSGLRINIDQVKRVIGQGDARLWVSIKTEA